MSAPLSDTVTLPGGGVVRGRGLRHPLPPGPAPAYGLYLGTERLRRRHDAALTWPHRWLEWRDFGVPSDDEDADRAIEDLHRRSGDGEPVEVACDGGIGRTGTVIACLAVLDGLGPEAAVGWARTHHHAHAIETPWQRRWVQRFAERHPVGGR